MCGGGGGEGWSCVLQSQTPRKKDEALLGLGTGRGIQCGRGCPALGSLVRNGSTATTPEPSPHAFDPLCSLRCRRLPTKADPTTPRKGLEMQQPLLLLHSAAQRAEVFLAGAGGPSVSEGGPSCSGHRGESRWRSLACCRLKPPSLRGSEVPYCVPLPLPPLLRD